MKRRARSTLWLWLILLLSAVNSPRADLIILWPSYRFRYDEHSGALIRQDAKDVNTETIDAITVGPNGDFFAAGNSMGWGAVFRLDGATGAYKSTFVPVSNGVSIPTRLQFGPDGDLYVSGGDSTDGNGDLWAVIRRYDGQTGAPKGYLIPASAKMKFGAMFEFGPDSNLYIANGQGEILRHNGVTGEFIDTYCAFPTNTLAGFQFGPDQNIYAFSWNGHVYRNDRQTRQSSLLLDALAAGMQGPRKMLIGPDGDLYLGDIQKLDVWRFDGKTGASKGIFIKGEIPLYGDGWITAMVFSGPRLNICHRDAGPCLRWPNTHGNFELQSCAGVGQPWQPVSETPSTEGCNLALQLPPSSNQSLFRLIKR